MEAVKTAIAEAADPLPRRRAGEAGRPGTVPAGRLLLEAEKVAYWLAVAPLAALLPASLAYRVACWRGDLHFRYWARERSEIVRNLRLVFGDELGLDEAERLARDFFRFRSCHVIDVMRLRGQARALGKLVEIRGREHLDAALAGGNGAILCSAHFGSHFSAFSLLHASGFPVTSIGRWHWNYTPGLTSVERRFCDLVWARREMRHRQRPNIEPCPGRVQVAAQAAAVLRANEVVTICSDAAPLDADRTRTVQVPLLGRQARLLPGVVTLAQLTGAPILMAFVYRSADYRHQVLEISPPVPLHGETEAAFGRCVAAMDAAIRTSPAQWIFWHNTSDLASLGLLPAAPPAVEDTPHDHDGGGVAVPGQAREVATWWRQRAGSTIRKIANGRRTSSPASANGQEGTPAACRSAGHVLVVVENIPLGFDFRALKQVDDLLASGYRVSAVTRRDPANAGYREQPGMKVLEYPPPREPRSKLGYMGEYGASLGWAAVLSLSVRLRGPIDIVQFCQPPDIYFPLGWILRGLGAKVVVDQRDLMPELFAARYGQSNPAMMSVLRWLERRTQRVAEHTLATNKTFRRRLIEAGATPERVTIIGNGPVLSRIQATAADRTLRGQHDFLCCWIGEMNLQDHVDLVLRVAAHIVRDLGRTDCGFAVIGDGECLEEARAQSAQLGLERWVHLPGWLPQDEVFSYLASADLGLDTSLQNEISPVKVIEYMAFGLPFVAFNLGETRVLGEGSSVLVPPGDIESYAREVVALIDDAARRGKMGEIGRKRVQEDQAWERQSIAYINVIRRLSQQSSGVQGVAGV